ncbi:MAG: InlB B-repeat-containing protein [Clostridiales bacterium]|nr:InlB B-repeat-containing protein [Clostridiales bacterium]
MDEQRAWLKSRRKKRLRITAVILSVCLLVTTYPDILTTISALAADIRSVEGTVTVTGFAKLDEETAMQEVETGTDISELDLPDTLKAYAEAADREDEKPAEDEEKPEEENPGADDEEKPEEENSGADDGTGEENPGADDGTGEENPGADDGTGEEEPGADDGTGEEEPGADDVSPLTIESGSFTLPQYQSENPTGSIAVQTLSTETIEIKNVTWQASPAYDSETEGVYVFTPILPEEELREKGILLSDDIKLPEITVEVYSAFVGDQELTPEQYAHMMAGIQDNPVLLTEEDILAQDPSLAPAGGKRRAAARAAAVIHPGTYVTTKDNENNAGTGVADDDIDQYIRQTDSRMPIEANIFIPKGELPTQSCYIAVRTYDVDWQGDDRFPNIAEYDKLFVNGERVGTLTGLDELWNTSYYKVPLSCLKEGKNTIRIEVWDCTDKSKFWDENPPLVKNENWMISIDWMQLVCDGGSRVGIEEFFISLTSAAAEGKQVAIQAETVIKSTNAGAKYDTEYSITDSKGYIVGSYQEANVSGGTHTFTITMPKNSKNGTYTVQGLLKSQSDGGILAADSMDFIFKDGVVQLGPKITHILSPDTLTNQNVTITPKVADAAGYTNISISLASQTATKNGTYNFTVNYKDNGVTKSIPYTVTVDNIDKVAPVITYEPITIREGQSLEEVEELFAAALSVTDDRKLAEEPFQYTVPADISAAPGTKSITVTATDFAGNTATKSCTITILPDPIKLTMGEPKAVAGSKDSYTLNAVLENTGGGTITETGFVWGVIENPTLDVNNGSAKTASVVKTKGGKLSANAAGIVYGVGYYARAYAKVTADGKTSVAYSDSKRFGSGIPAYGTFSVSGVSGSTFTITRTGGTDGKQTVYYRTVNGSAIGGTHFTHAAGSLTFADGETSKTVTVTEKGVTTAYGGRTTTSYANADRTYSLEIYRVEGGGGIDQSSRYQTRTMSKSSSYTIDRTIYTTEKSKIEVSATSGGHVKRIADTTGKQGGTQTNISFLTNRYKEKNYNTSANFSDYYTGANQKTYLNATADGWYYRYVLLAYEDMDGYEYAYFGTKALKDTHYDLDGGEKGALISGIAGQLWMCNFQLEKKGAAGTYNFPDTRTGGEEGSGMPYNSSGTPSNYNNKTYVKLGLNDTCYLYFGATGRDTDIWYIDGLTGYALVYDEKEPTCIGVAPMAGGAYLPGDPITVALVFDEIVDKTNSSLTNVAVNTNVGTLTYAGGADTNVLYFTGTVSSTASLSGSSALKVTGITNSGNIKDMCNLTGTASTFTSRNTNIEVDATKPAVTITAKTSGSLPRHQAQVTATGAASIQYVWTQDTTMPAYGWQDVKSGTTLTGNCGAAGKTETWYLHVKATASSGASTHEYKVFTFKQPAITGVSVRAESSANSADVSDVWKTSSKYIVVQYDGAQTNGTTLTFDGPQTSTQGITTASGTKYLQVTKNGTYTVTLTDSYGNVISKSVKVEKIDTTAPTATITEARSTEAGAASPVYHELTMTAQAADLAGASEPASGVKTVQYAFSTLANSSSVAGSAWTTLTDTDKLADGRYKLTYTATQTTQTKIYLHIKVTDNAGNATTARSADYTVIKEPEASAKPQITLTQTSPSASGQTNGDATLTWKLTNGGAGNCTVNAGGANLTDKGTGDSGTITVSKNGVYMVSVYDENGDSAQAALVVNCIDKEAPTLSALTVTQSGYAKTKSVSVSGITDNLTTLYDEKGVTGKGGSGVAKIEYQREGGSTWTTVNASGDTASFTVNKQGTYKVRLTDQVGNESKEYTIKVEGIDNTAPILTAQVNATPKTSGWYTDSTVPVTLTYEDKAGAEESASGVKSVQYAFTMDKNTTPANLTSLGSTAVSSGSAVCSLTSNGTYYLYCKVTDQAGNVTAGWMKADGSIGSESSAAVPIKKDSNKGSGTISGPAESQPASSGLNMSITVYYGPSGGELTATGQTDSIGTLAAHAGPSTKSETVSYTTKTIGTNYIYLSPISWGSRYYWSYYVRKVSFDSQGGSAVADQLVWTKQASTSTSTSVDCKLTKPNNPTRTGYTFGGWYTDAACTNEFDFEKQTQIRTDTTLYAKWTAITYEVDYVLKVPQPFTTTVTYSEADYEAPTDKTTYIYGDEMELPVPTLPTDVSGFVFDGWYTTADYSGARYTSVPKTAASDITYYGRFRDVEAPISYKLDVWNNGKPCYNTVDGVRWYNANTTRCALQFRENKGIEKYIVLWDGNVVELPEEEGILHTTSMAIGNKWLQGIYFARNLWEGYEIQTGTHTYTVQAWDAEGNMGEFTTTLHYDPDAPTIGDITYTVTPVIRYRTKDTYTDSSISSSKFVDNYETDSTEVRMFGKRPTIRIPVSDATSGLWKLTYTMTRLNSKGQGLTTETKEIDLTGQGSEGIVEIEMEKDWHGTITDIILYDKAGNQSAVTAIGEIMVDTTAPTISNIKLLGKEPEDRWYSESEFETNPYFDYKLGDNFSFASYRMLKNGKEIRNGSIWAASLGLHIAIGKDGKVGEEYLGENTFTWEATDPLGNVTTKSVTIKIRKDDGTVQEQTPQAVCDYPADAISHLVANAEYGITINGNSYPVTTDEQGRIPFETTFGSITSLCGTTIQIVKKGITVDGTPYTTDSEAQSLTINARPDANAVNSATVVAELLKEAGDAKITLTMSGSSDDTNRTWEYQTPGSTAWTTAPTDDSGNVTITNLPAGNITLRVKAQANSSDTVNDGFPHGVTGTQTVSEGAGTITVQYNLNDNDSTVKAQGKPEDTSLLTYQSTLTAPTAPTRTGYKFMGWYVSEDDYVPGGSTEQAWRFAGTANAQIVGEILGDDRDKYEDHCKMEEGVYVVTLYAGWREAVAPELTATLTDNSNGAGNSNDGAGGSGAGAGSSSGGTGNSSGGAGSSSGTTITDDGWHNSLAIDLNFSDNVGVTKLYVKKDSAAYVELSGDGIGDGASAGTTYKLTYPAMKEGASIEEGVHTYTFMAKDAVGNDKTVSVTTKLDTTKPVFGEASFENGYKNLWNWIIRKESLTITIPITEKGSGIGGAGAIGSVEYELVEDTDGASGSEWKTATVSGSTTKGYAAKITIPADFKGQVVVKATDNAGNESDEMHIGSNADGDLRGVIVEKGAPQISVKADRNVSDATSTVTATDAAAGAANGVTLDNDSYYNSAPRLFVTVTDTWETKSGESALTAGLASIEWTIDGSGEHNPMNPVQANYLGTGSSSTGTGSSGTGTGSSDTGTGSSDTGAGSSGKGTDSSGTGAGSSSTGTGSSGTGADSYQPLTTHSFTIAGLEGQTGEVKVTVTATDNAGNVTKKTITLHIKDKMAIPSPVIDYVNEKLTGLEVGADYIISSGAADDAQGGTADTADANGSIAIKEEWFGSDVKVRRKTTDENTILDSDEVQITLNARPDAPVITKTDETIKNKGDGMLHHLTTAMEYRSSTDGGKTWTEWTAVADNKITTVTNIGGDGKSMTRLPACEMEVRLRAVANTTDSNDGAPYGQYTPAQIEEGKPLTVTFDTNGGSSIESVTGLAWNDTVKRPNDPVKDGYAVEGWYRENALSTKWNFAQADAGNTAGTGTAADLLNDKNGVDVTADAPGITLYAKWVDDEAPSLDATLVAGDSRAAVDEDGWYQNPAIVLTYSDNEEVTKLFVKIDGETDREAAYKEITDYTTAAENGTDAAGNKRFQYTYTELSEGQHTYTFKAQDAAGKETETTLTAKRDSTALEFGNASYEEGHKSLWDWIIRKESLIITIPITENGSGVESVEYTLTPAGDTAGGNGSTEGGTGGDTDSGTGGSTEDGTGGSTEDGTGGSTDDTGNSLNIITGTAKISGSQSAGYTATISIEPDFKGTVKITGSDKAGNAAAEKTIGTDGSGAGGVIVENNAPQITILADRYPSENDATQADGTQLRDERYNGAPGLVVTVADDGAGDGSVTTSGIASGIAKVSWEVAGTSEKGERTGTGEDGAGTSYNAQMVREDTFTIPATALQAAENQGKTRITVTVTAADQAGNTAVKMVNIDLKSKENTPNAKIGYVAETITGLKANTAYVINETGVLSSAGGAAEITESWFGTQDNTIVLSGDGERTMDSLPQKLDIPARPAAPSVTAGNASYPGAADGTITVTDTVNGAAYEFSADGGDTWKVVSGAQITGLAAGTYQIRQKALEEKNFKSLPAEVSVEETPAKPYDMPAAEIDYEKELLTGIAAGAVYEISYDVPENDGNDSEGGEGDGGGEENGGDDSGDGGEENGGDDDEADYEGITETFTAAEGGTLPVKDEWLKQKLHIIRMGNSREWCASDTQQLDIPARPAAPENLTGISITRENANPDKLAQIKGLTAGTTYEVSTDGGKTWLAEKKTADASGTISGLDAPQSYTVRVAASNAKKNFAGYPSETAVEVDNFTLAVTFMEEDETADGTTDTDRYKVYQTADVYYGRLLDTVPAVPTKKAADGSLLVGEWCKDKEGNTPVDFYTEKITEDTTVYAAGYAAGYTVTLAGGTGYSLTAQRGSVSPVKSGGSFTFVFKLSEGYEKTENFAVKVNGVVVTLSADGTYTIENITAAKTVTVEGVKKTAAPTPPGPDEPDNPDNPDKPDKPGGGSGDEPGGNSGDDSGGDDDTPGDNPGNNPPTDNIPPTDTTSPTDTTPPTDNTPPADDTSPADEREPGDGGRKQNDGDDKTLDDGGDRKLGDDDDKTLDDGSGKTPDGENDKEPGVTETVVPAIIEDGKIVIPSGTPGGSSEDGTGGQTEGIGGQTDGTDGQTEGTAGDYAIMTDAANGVTTARTIFQIHDENGNPAGTVIVTVVCKEQKWTAGVKDVIAVANAVLTKEQMQLVQSGETIEIRIDVKDISGSVPQADKETIENCIEAYKDEIPGLVLGMYIDISMYIRIGDGDWNAITKAGEPVDVVVGIPEELQADGRAYYIIRAHEGAYTLMEDADAAQETITISTDLFSSYAIAYQQTDGADTDGNGKCRLCHICPTFLGICCFIWLAVIIVTILIIWLVIRRRRKEQEEPEQQA